MGKEKQAEKEKPLEKMTATELRETAKEMSDITGAHGMNKAELIAAIKKSRGIEDDTPRRSRGSVREIKEKMRAMRTKWEAAATNNETEMAAVFRRRLLRLKKKSRRAAA